MYWAIVRLALQRQLSYRAANLAGLATNLFFGLLRAYVLIALFAGRTSVAGYDVRAAVTFTGISQALLAYIAIFGWWDIMRTIRTGEVASDLTRPVDYYWYWCMQDLGRALAQLGLRGLPIMALYAVAYRIALPPTPAHWLALPVSLLLALQVSFAWRFLVSLAAFWTRDAMGVGRLAWTLSMFLSGFLMPIAFFPPWLAAAMRLTPFPAMIYAPIEVCLGLVDGVGLAVVLGQQLLWAVLLYGLARVALAAGVRKLVIQGG